MKILTIVLLAIGLTACSKLQPDSPAEEMLEEVIKAKTGLDIDVTPGSPENEG